MNIDLIWTDAFDLLFAGTVFDSLIKHGGSLDTRSLQKEVERRLGGLLTDADREPYPDSASKGRDEPKWWTDMRAQYGRWRKREFIEKWTISGWGIWQITQKGRNSFDANRHSFESEGRLESGSDWTLTDVGRKFWKDTREKYKRREELRIGFRRGRDFRWVADDTVAAQMLEFNLPGRTAALGN